MKKMRRLWKELTESRTPEEEAGTISSICQYIANHDGYFKIEVYNSEGNIGNFRSISADTSIQSARIIFNWGIHRFVGENWEPLDKNNVALFFRE